MALLNTLIDTFDTAGSIDGAKWSFSNLGLNGSASCGSGKLLLNMGTTSAYFGECHVTSVANYDMTNNGAYIKLVNKTDPTRTWAGLRIETSADSTDYLDMYLAEDGLIYILGVNNGSTVWGTTITYSSTNHSWWRIRESGGTIYFDAAADNSGSPGTWNNLYSASLSALGWSGVVTSVKAHIFGRLIGSGAASAPVHEWDGFNTVSGSTGGVNATLSATESSTADTLAGTTQVKIAATLAANEATTKDTFSAIAATGTIRNVTFAITEASTADTFAASAFRGTNRTATLAATETTADTFAATATRGNTTLPPYQPPQGTAAFIAWLKTSDSVKCLLVEVDVLINGVSTTLYLSNLGYVTAPTDSPANTLYPSDIIGGCTVASEINLGYTTELTLGDVEISNVNGVRDAWFGYVWKNRPIRFYVGDMRWARADFRLVFSGTCHDLTSREYDKANIVLADKMQRLNQSVSSQLLGGSTDNKDKLIPLCFGEVSNITPLLTNPATLEYQVHNGAIQDIVEVRDEGVPVPFNKNLTTGKFTLVNQPAGRITCTVQGDKYIGTYATKLGEITKRLMTGFGTLPFSFSDIDTANFATYDSNNAQPLGIYLASRENILDICNILASSMSSAVALNGSGLVRLLKMELTADTIVQYINESHFVAKSFEIFDRPDVQPAFKIAYCRNYTPQPDLQSGIPAEHKALWADEWMTITAADTSACSTYGLPTQPTDQIETYLITNYDAQGELFHRLALWGVQRTIYGFQAFPELLLLELGDWVNITHSRFEFASGKDAFILAYEKDWYNFRCSFKVLV